jgi:hypothetical protein
MRRRLAGPEGMVLKEVVAADPVGMSALVLAKGLPLQTGLGGAQLVDGRILSRDGRHVLLLAEPRFPSSNSGQSAALVADLLRLAREVEDKFPGVHVAVTGGHRMSVDNATLIKGDATRCILIGMGAMLVLCLSAFRRRWLRRWPSAFLLWHGRRRRAGLVETRFCDCHGLRNRPVASAGLRDHVLSPRQRRRPRSRHRGRHAVWRRRSVWGVDDGGGVRGDGVSHAASVQASLAPWVVCQRVRMIVLPLFVPSETGRPPSLTGCWRNFAALASPGPLSLAWWCSAWSACRGSAAAV